MRANKIHGGTIHIDPSSFLLADNCSFLLTKLFNISNNTNYLHCNFLYSYPRWERVTNREMAKSLETEYG